MEGLLAQVQALLAQASSVADAIAAEKKVSYDEGFAAGVASVGGVPSDKIYSQAELDAKIQEAVSSINAELVAVKADLESLKAQIDSKIAESIGLFKAELLAKYNEKQVVEQQAETGFADLLK